MEFAFAILLGLPTVVGLVGVQVLRAMRRRQVRVWREAAVLAGVEDLEECSSILWSEILTGRMRNRRVRFYEYGQQEEGRPGRGMRITVEGGSGITLRPETPATALEKASGAREIELGDERFDTEVYIRGEEDVLRAVLDPDTRRTVQALLRGGLPLTSFGGTFVDADITIRDGDVVVEFNRNESSVRTHLPGILTTMFELGLRLERPPSLVKRIVLNTRAEPEWQMRQGNLRLLANAHPRHPATLEALERGCQDERQAVQLECALALGVEKAQATLLEIASSEWADDADAARATAALGARLPQGTALTILAHALRTRRHETARAIIDVLGTIGGPGVVAPLAKVLALEKGVLAAAAAKSLGTSRAAAAEVPLLQALRSGGAEVRVAGAVALGHAGSSSAVLPLKEAAERSGRDAALRKAAREAIAEIQSRLGGASPGQLSLAEGDAGQLSLADVDPRGQVSIAEPGDAKSAPKPA